MCLYKTHRFPKISIKPIKVYKCLKWEDVQEGRLSTPFTNTEVKVGDTIKAKRWWFFGVFRDEIRGEGVHAYTVDWRGNFEAEKKAVESMNGLKYRNLEVTINDCYKTTTEEI